MFAVNSNSVAFPLMVAAMLLLGTWPNGFKLIGARARTEHMYMDFASGFVVLGVVGCMIFGNAGPDSPNVVDQSVTAPRILLAGVAGIVLCCGNLCFVYASEILGMTVSLFVQVLVFHDSGSFCSASVALALSLN